jgi:MFS family permease
VTAYRRLLGNRPFALLWVGATISILGDALTWVSLVWLTYELGGSSLEIGVLAVCYTGPVIVGGLVAGLLLDRFDRRRLLIADNVARGAVMLSVPIAASLGVLAQPHIYVVAAVYGLLYMISLAGIPSMLPDLVADEDLPTANAMESISYGLGGVAGPAMAGVLIGLIGAATNLAIDAVSYFAFAACLLFVRVPSRAADAASFRPGGVVAEDVAKDGGAKDDVVAEGGHRPAIAFIVRTPAILAITLMFMAANIGEGMLTVLLPVYAVEVLVVGATGYGLLVSAMTAGTLAGSLAVGAVRWPWPLGRSIAVAQLLGGVALLGLALQPPFALAAALLVVFGLLVSPLTIWAQTIRMRLIPESLRGRVFSLLRTLMQSTPPVGGLVAGSMLGVAAIGPVALVLGAVIAIPGAVGLVHGALSEPRTTPPVVAGGLSPAGGPEGG